MTSDSFIVNEEEDGLRLDKLLTIEIPGYSRSYLQGLLKDGNVLVNGKSAKASMKMKENDAVSFSIPDKILPDIVPENLHHSVSYPAPGSGIPHESVLSLGAPPSQSPSAGSSLPPSE